ncbi:MAG: hypothetical protein ACTSUS_06275 [Candidatus Freyarchaeota archaeon]
MTEEFKKLKEIVKALDFSRLLNVEEERVFERAKDLVSQLDLEKLRTRDGVEKEKFEAVLKLSRVFAEKILEWLGRQPPDSNKPIMGMELKEYWKVENSLWRKAEEEWRAYAYAARYLSIFGELANKLIVRKLYDEALRIALTIPWFHPPELVANIELLSEEDLSRTAKEAEERFNAYSEVALTSGVEWTEEVEEEIRELAIKKRDVMLDEMISYLESSLKESMSRRGVLGLLAACAKDDDEALKAILNHLDELSKWDKAIVASKLRYRHKEIAKRIYSNLREAGETYRMLEEVWC